MPCAQRRMSVADTGSSSCTLGRGWLMYRSTSLVSSTVVAGASLIALPLRSHGRRGYLLYESILRLSAERRQRGSALGQAEHPLADDVALNLRRPAVQPGRQRVVPLEGDVAVHRRGRSARDCRQLPGALQRLRTQQLEDRELRAAPAAQTAGQRPVAGDA